tara:strand:- start:526 stop:924 length:399 start_codon:yes stop_codon:yes gene_type:complete
MSRVSLIIRCYTTPQLCKAFKCTPQELFYQAEVGPDGLTRFERNFKAQCDAVFNACTRPRPTPWAWYFDSLYEQAWADNRVWDELERKAKGCLIEMKDWSEAERQDELMEHYYEALERKGKPSRTKRWRLRA